MSHTVDCFQNCQLEASSNSVHTPVLVKEVVEFLCPKEGGVYVDATFGMGGHTLQLLRCQENIKLIIAIDMDKESLNKAKEFVKMYDNKIHFYCGNFTKLGEYLSHEGITAVDGIIMDLGVSSYHYEESGRGFSFKRDEPLDMRLSDELTISAYDLVNSLNEEKLEEIIRIYGEESWSKKIAKAIVNQRKIKKIETSKELAQIIYSTIPKKYHSRHIHPATKTFQALRIAINFELDNLHIALRKYPDFLVENGRLCIISFHSLEDRLVKHSFKADRRLKIITKKPITPQEDEVKRNPRSRSAKLRVAEKINQVISDDLS